MSKQYQVIHKKSNVLTNGQPKLPSASTIEYGEIAINYAKGGETMSIKNANNEIVTFSSDAKILGQMPAVADYFDGAEYDSNNKRINFKHGNTVKAYVDATDFIKDGMVDDVTITTPTSGGNSGVTCLVVTFNTESGKEDIEIPLSLIFNPSDYYNKNDADEKFLTISAYTEDEEVVAAALNDLNDRIENIYVPRYTSELVNDSDFVTTADTAVYATTAHTHTAAEVGAMATSERSNYSTTAHTHTAAEVGAMATSERGNYLTTATTIPEVTVIRYGETIPQSIIDELAVDVFGDSDSEEPALLLRLDDGKVATYYGQVVGLGYVFTSVVGTSAETYTYYYAYSNGSWTSGNKKLLMSGATLDSIPDGSNRKLSNYSTTAHTHSVYSTTAHTHTAAEVGAMATSERSNYATTAHTHTASEVGAMATSERSNYSTTGHTHSEYATTAHTHTAAEVGAVATSEMSKYATTAHTHSEYATTAHTHTAAEVGAMATSERSNYSTTGHTHTAAEVGAMATSERSNYSTTGHTHSQYATTAHTHTAAEVGAMATSERSNYATTAHTHTAAEVGAMATSERSNYSTTGHTHDYLPLSGGDVTDDIFLIENGNEWVHTQLSNSFITFNSGNTNAKSVSINPYWKEGQIIGGANLYLPNKTGTIAITDDIPTEASLTSSGFTKNGLTGFTETDPTVPAWAKAENKPTYTASEVGAMATSERSNYSTTGHTHSEYATTADTANFITSADTGIKVYEISVSGTLNAVSITNALPQNFYSLAMADLGNGILPVIKITLSDGSVIPLWFQFHADGQENLVFSYSYYNQIYTYVCDSENIDIQYTSYDLLNEGLLRLKLTQSGYTQSGITGINVNGTAVTITNGVADITVQSGGSGLPAVTAADNGKVLTVVNGQWSASTPTVIYTGTNSPDNTLGNDGDIYLQTS